MNISGKIIETLSKSGIPQEQVIASLIGHMYYQSMIWVFIGIFLATLGSHSLYIATKGNLLHPNSDHAHCWLISFLCYTLAFIILLANFSDMMSPEGAVYKVIGSR